MKTKIIARLTDQLRAKGVKDAEAMAIAKLKEYGTLDAAGNLTPHGEKRNAMTPEQRAIDRAVQRSGNRASEYTYDPKTNRATLKGRK